MNTKTIVDYPCPDCGYNGPHELVDVTRAHGVDVEVCECGSCRVEFRKLPVELS